MPALFKGFDAARATRDGVAAGVTLLSIFLNILLSGFIRVLSQVFLDYNELNRVLWPTIFFL